MRKLIIKMAKHYLLTKKATIQSVSDKFGVAYSTANKYLNKTLKGIDIDLWQKVQNKKIANINRTHQNFSKSPKKRCFLSFLCKK